jgi:hypothetical protein
MKDFLSILEDRTKEFGNHYRKYLQVVNMNMAHLIQRLEENKKRDLVHIIHPAYDFAGELHIIAETGSDLHDKIRLMGTFFALQFLHFNRQALDLLRMDILSADADKTPVYKKFMRSAGNNFRMFTSHFIHELMNMLIDVKTCPDFVILGVGTKADQDDIDVGIVDDGVGDRRCLNRAIARLTQEMVRFASSFHFHLSEHIGDNYYSATIEEYKKTLAHGIKDYVIINEMLSAAPIAGSQHIFERFKTEITDRYFYHSGGDNKYHEGYLRGIVGEVTSLLEKPISPSSINLKDDGLRLTKNIICALKTIHAIHAVNAWDIIDELKQKNAGRLHEYCVLERSLTFFEIFRYLYQQFITQNEEIVLDDNALRNIRRIAHALGYTNIGQCHAEQHLLVHYYEHIQNVRNIVPHLVDDIRAHFMRTSAFTYIFDPGHRGNMAEDFIAQFKFFQGTSFWDDIFDALSASHTMKRFVNDLDALSRSRRKNMIREYFDLLKYDIYTLLNLLVLLGSHENGMSIFRDINDFLIKHADEIPDFVRNLAYVANRFPHLLIKYFALNDEAGLNMYSRLFTTYKYEKDIAQMILRLEHMIQLHRDCSIFFKRYFMRSFDRYPNAITLIENPERLKEFSHGIYSDIESVRSFREKKGKLGDFYDFELTRVGLKTLDGISVEKTNAEFTEFSDLYVNILFDICRREIDAQYSKRIITDDLLAIFSAGGHAREQAFDDDYDMIVLLNTNNSEILEYSNKIISKMNREIIKRGTIPHHRFADIVGRFVVLLGELELLLSEKRTDIFIEKSQILGARLTIGSHRFEKEFHERVVQRFIFDRKDEYVAQMIEEITSRHKATDESVMSVENNIKECTGGLRDIEMMMLIIKAKFEITTPVNSELFMIIADNHRELRDDVLELAQACRFLKQLRDVYRLTIGATDIILLDALHIPAVVMGYGSNQALYEQFTKINSITKSTLTRLIHKVQSM